MCVFAWGGEIPPLLLHLFLSKVVVRKGGGGRKRVEHQHRTHLHKKKGGGREEIEGDFPPSPLCGLLTPTNLLLLLQSVRFVIHRHPSPLPRNGERRKGKKTPPAFSTTRIFFPFRTPVAHPHKKFPSKDQPQLVDARRIPAPSGIFPSSSFAVTVCLCLKWHTRGRSTVGRLAQ